MRFLLIALAFTTPAFAEGGSVLTFGVQNVDTTRLDAKLEAEGLEGFGAEGEQPTKFATVGLRLFNASDSMDVHLDLQYLLPKSGASDTFSSRLEGGYAMLGFGPALSTGHGFLATTGFDVGMAGMDLSLTRSTNLTKSLPSGLPRESGEENVDESRRLQARFFVVGAHFDLLWGKDGDGMIGGLRAGYLYTPDYAQWKTSGSDGLPLSDMPDVGIRGAYLMLCIGGGKI